MQKNECNMPDETRNIRTFKTVGLFKYIFSPVLLLTVAGGAYGQSVRSDIPAEIQFVDQNGVDLASDTLNISFQLVTFGGGTRLTANFNLNQPMRLGESSPPYPVTNPQDFLNVAYSAMATAVDPLSGGGIQQGRLFGSDIDGRVTAAGIASWKHNGWGTANSNGLTSYREGLGEKQFVEFVDLTVTFSDGSHPTFGIFDQDGNGVRGAHAFTWHDGEFWDYFYYQPAGCQYKHLRAIVSSTGHAVQYSYVSELCPAAGSNAFFAPKSVIGINLSQNYCDFTNGALCIQDAAAENKTIFTYNSQSGIVDVSFASGQIKRFGFANSNGTWKKEISSLSNPNTNQVINYTYGPMGQCIDQWAVKTATVDGRTWTYQQDGWDNADRVCVAAPTGRVDPLGQVVNAASAEASSPGGEIYTGPNTRGLKYYYDSLGQTWEIFPGVGVTSFPEGNGFNILYDDRRNLTSISARPKPNAGSPVLVYSALYLPDCNNPKVCNKPIYTQDAYGNRTDYTYDQNHGGILSEMGPPPSQGAARPLKIFTYVQKSAYILNSAGGLVSTNQLIWLPASETICQTATGSNVINCDNSSQKIIKTFEYGPDGTANNLLLRGVLSSSASISARTCFGYDKWGRKISETTPNSNLAVCP